MRILLITYFLSIVAIGFTQEKDSLYTKGIEALTKKDYRLAEKLFMENIVISPSFEGYYNLGFSYAKQKKWVQSLWANEAALKYAPTNSKAIYNAKFAYEKIAPDDTWKHPYSWTKRIMLSIGEVVWLILMIGSSITVAFSVYFLIVKKRNSKALWSKRLIIPFVIILMLSVFCFNNTKNHYEAVRYAYSFDNKTTLYLSPEGLEVDENLPENVRLNVTSDQKEWLQVLSPNFSSYWVKKEDVLVY